MTVSLATQATPYFDLAEKLVDGRILEDQLPQCTTGLPPLQRELLDYLAVQADKAGRRSPQYGWAVTAVADAAAQLLPDDPFLQALAAWYLARAANAWVRPQRVETVVARARAGFVAVHEAGWVAACDWQRHAVPWIWPDFAQSVARLEEALAGLLEVSFTEFVPSCRLSLAFAHLLVGNFAAAVAQTAEAETAFQKVGDQFSLGYCLYIRASCQRRNSNFEQALINTQSALDIFRQLDATVYMAIAQYGLGHIVRVSQGDFAAAEEHFRQARELFEKCDLLLWVAQCDGGLAQVFTYRGQLALADQALQQARQIYERYRVPGLWADNLLDSGQLALFKGQYTSSLFFLEQAEVLYQETGNQWMPIVALMDQGEVCLQQGRYHEALRRLEKAHASLQQHKISYRQAECEWRLAHAWIYLGHTQQAHAFLDKAIAHYEEAKHFGYSVDAYNRRAEIYLRDHQWEEAIALLQEAINAARQQKAVAQTAISQRLLGEAFNAAGRPQEALPYLLEARQYFTDIGMMMEQAACDVVLGSCYVQIDAMAAAQTAWQQAREASQDTMPDIAWQAHAGLAQLAEDAGDNQVAQQQYRLMLQTLLRLRQGLWQPALVGAYFSRPGQALDRAVTFAARSASGSHSLDFIELSKASIGSRRLQGSFQTSASSPALTELAAEIRWLQDKIRANFQNNRGWLRPPEERPLRQQLVQKIQEHNALKDRLERAAFPEQPLSGTTFDLAQFRRAAQARLGQNWVALDYYLAGDQLHGVLLTPDDCIVWSAGMSGQVRAALRLLERTSRPTWDLTPRDWQALGNWLLPEPVRRVVTAVTTLIIAPHRQLHRLPWAALLVAGQPLVNICLPAVVPSLNSLALLWQRPLPSSAARRTGLLLAVSDFQGRHPPLSQVRREADGLAVHLDDGSQELRETEATRSNLARLSQENGLSRFAYLHIASHAFHDPVSGRLSGLALYDHDLWLDELWEHAPLPPLVMLSACSGSQSLVYEGDEHVGLAATCLAAGAQSVVGSLWPIADEGLPRFMMTFYDHFFSGRGPAQSLALAQRTAWQQGLGIAEWGSFLCVGQP